MAVEISGEKIGDHEHQQGEFNPYTVVPRTPPLTLRSQDWVLAALSVGIVLVSYGALKYFGHPPKVTPRAHSEAIPQPVTTTPAIASTESIDISVQGVARPFRHIAVATEVAGRVRMKSEMCQEATFVRKGQLLFEIDPTDYESAVRRHTQELKQTVSALAEWQVERENFVAQIDLAQQQAELANRDLERLRGLLPTGGASQAAVEQAQRTEITARNALLTLTSNLRLHDAKHERALSTRDLQQVILERAERDLARTKIFAPCDGTIVTENVEQDGFAQAGSTMVVVNDVGAMEVACQLEVDDMVWLWGTKTLHTTRIHSSLSTATATEPTDDSSAPVDPRTAAYQFPRWPVTVEFPFQDLICQWDGELVRYGGTGVDPATRTVPCQVSVTHPLGGRVLHLDGTPDQSLPPPPLTVGMFVTVRAKLKPHTPLIRIPVDAIRAGSVVWIAEENKLRIVPVKIARRGRDSVFVYSQPDQAGSLKPGDAIVTSPLAIAIDGTSIKPVPSSTSEKSRAGALESEVAPL